MHTIMRIDKVEKQGTAKIVTALVNVDTVTPFALPAYTPSGTSGKR